MIGKGAHEIKPATLAEVVRILEKRQGTGGEFGFEQQTTLDYAKKFAHLKLSDAQEMEKELEKLELKPEIAVKIVDLLPKTRSLLALILAKDRVELPEKSIGEVEKLVAKYSEKAKKKEAPAKEKKDDEKAEEAKESKEIPVKEEGEKKIAEAAPEEKPEAKEKKEEAPAESEGKKKTKKKAAKKKEKKE